MGEFTGRVVLISGAGGGLGTVVTRAFLEAGATVAAVSRFGSEISADLTRPDETARAVETVRARFGRLDVLLHLAGGFEGGTPVAQTLDGVWNRMFDLNVNSAFYIARAVLPAMLEAGYGRIVAIGSKTAVEPVATLAAYGASKAALVALVRTIALEVKRTGVTANVVLPSVIDTPANRAADSAADFSRWVKPESIARLLLWLASEAAADINGAVVPIYGRV
jgi:NAD(P)-dependent dehydrogenase (short-subunit alcohol dehydrogenase family)